MSNATGNVMSMKADGAITIGYAVVVSAAGEVQVASGANDDCVGLADWSAADGEGIGILYNGKHSQAMAGGAIAANDLVYVSAAGKMLKLSAVAGTYNVIGRAITAASADGKVFELIIEKRKVIVT